LCTTGTVLSPQRRTAVLGIARAAGAFVVEDDFARRLAHADSPPLPLPLAADDPDGIVVHVRSLTKAASPSPRIGALSARGPVLERLRAIQVVDSLFVPRPLQETALELVGSPAWTSHLRALASALRDRRTTLLTALSGALPTLLPHQPPRGGYHLWLRLPDGTDEHAITATALRRGVAVAAGGTRATGATSSPSAGRCARSPSTTGPRPRSRPVAATSGTRSRVRGSSSSGGATPTARTGMSG
jgi:DNA-binding transcriptional MocR family regulator